VTRPVSGGLKDAGGKQVFQLAGMGAVQCDRDQVRGPRQAGQAGRGIVHGGRELLAPRCHFGGGIANPCDG
jgi:hypothetical protein